MTVLWSVLGFIVVMGIVIAIHEWGHYQVARWFHIRVNVFSIGFGKSLYEKQGKETCFKIGVIPFGGYVRFIDESEGPVPKALLPYAFNHQSVYKRFAVVAAGPLINLVFAWLVFSVMYLIGVSGFKPVFNEVTQGSPVEQALPEGFFQPLSGVWSVVQVGDDSVSTWRSVHQAILKAKVHHEESLYIEIEHLDSGERIPLRSIALEELDLNQPEQNWLTLLGFKPFQMPLPSILGTVVPGGAAEKAGLLSGDKIVFFDDTPIAQWQDLVREIQSRPNELVSIVYVREGARYTTMVSLSESKKPSGEVVGKMGIGAFIPPETRSFYSSVTRYGLLGALEKGGIHTIELLQMSLIMMQRMFFGDVSLQHLSGPISIAQFSGQAMQSGFITFLSLLGLISLSIGILNLLPIPVLDGGHLVYYLIEIIKGSPVSPQVMDVGQRIGVVLIIGLTLVALFNDVLRISNG